MGDDWLDKEENNIVMDLLFKWLCRDDEAPSLVAAAPSQTSRPVKDRGLTRHSFDPGADATFELAEGEHHHAEADKEYARVPTSKPSPVVCERVCRRARSSRATS